MEKNIDCKPFKSTAEQIALLRCRGLIVSDTNYAFDILRKLNYYRLSAYSLTLRSNDIFYPNITFENIVELYNFDTHFRNIVLKYTPVIECTFRALIAYYHSQKYGPLGYMNSSYFKDKYHHMIFINKFKEQVKKSSDVFVQHHKNDLKNVYPFWVAIEIINFNDLSKLYKNLLPEVKNYIARYYYKLSSYYIENWLHRAVIDRNIGAHGGRFYNRNNLQAVKLDNKLKSEINTKSAFAYIFAIYKLLPENELRIELIKDLKALFIKFPFALKKHMGFPDNWVEILEDQMPY